MPVSAQLTVTPVKEVTLPVMPLLLVKIDMNFPDDGRELNQEWLFDTRCEHLVYEKTIRWWRIALKDRAAWADGSLAAPTHVVGVVDWVAVHVARLTLLMPSSVRTAFAEQSGKIELPAEPARFDDPIRQRLLGHHLLDDSGTPMSWQYREEGIWRWHC